MYLKVLCLRTGILNYKKKLIIKLVFEISRNYVSFIRKRCTEYVKLDNFKKIELFSFIKLSQLEKWNSTKYKKKTKEGYLLFFIFIYVFHYLTGNKFKLNIIITNHYLFIINLQNVNSEKIVYTKYIYNASFLYLVPQGTQLAAYRPSFSC